MPYPRAVTTAPASIAPWFIPAKRMTTSPASCMAALPTYRLRFPMRPASAGTRKLAAMGTMDMMVAMVTDSSLLPMTAV